MVATWKVYGMLFQREVINCVPFNFFSFDINFARVVRIWVQLRFWGVVSISCENSYKRRTCNYPCAVSFFCISTFGNRVRFRVRFAVIGYDSVIGYS